MQCIYLRLTAFKLHEIAWISIEQAVSDCKNISLVVIDMKACEIDIHQRKDRLQNKLLSFCYL